MLVLTPKLPNNLLVGVRTRKPASNPLIYSKHH